MTAKKSVSQKDLNGLEIISLGNPTTAQSAVTKSYSDAQSTADRSRANHTGTQLWATISDGDAQVKLIPLNLFAAPTGNISAGGFEITTLADGTTATAAVTKQQLDAAIAGLATGMTFKGAVRAVSTANVDVASAPVNIDGIAAAANDVFLLTGQTTGSENGPWVWHGTSTPMTRPTNWDTTGEALPGSMWIVVQGSFDNQLAVLTNDTFVLGTTTGTFVFIDPAAASDNDTGYTETSPVTSAGAAWAVNHNLGSKAVHVSVYRTASPFDEVDVNITRDTTNQVNVRPDIALASGEFTVVVSRVV